MSELPVPTDVLRRVADSVKNGETGHILCPGHEHFSFHGDNYQITITDVDGYLYWILISQDGMLFSPFLHVPLQRRRWMSVIDIHKLFLSTDRGTDPICSTCPRQLNCLSTL